MFASVQLRTEDLGQRFGRRVLFRRMSTRLQGGESIAVIGPNGSGKSTLLRLLAGVLTPSKGSVQLNVDGERMTREKHPLRVGLVAPYLNVYDGFSPRENLQFIASARRLRDSSSRIQKMLDLAELSDRADDLVSTFSSGMKQRVKFAAALLPRPPVLLLDEPRVNLDAAGLEMVAHIVARQREWGGIVVVATNDPAEAAAHERRIRIEDHR